MLQLSEIATILSTDFDSKMDRSIEHILIDSRKASNPTNTLFFALKGERHDGHQYIEELIHKGYTAFVVEKRYDKPSNSKYCYLTVKNTLEALQLLAKHQRNVYKPSVVAITGSNGKTIVKEWLSQLLASEKKVFKSPKSYNSQVGVPLSVWPLQNDYEIALFEAGVSRAGEMQKLTSILQPNIGIMTNIGSAHDEGFSSRQEKAKEKLSLFKKAELIIYCLDHEVIHKEVENFGEIKKTWSQHEKFADYFVCLQGFNLNITKGDTTFSFKINQTDAASVENLTHCLVLCLELGLKQDELQISIDQLQPVSMRMEMLPGINNSYIINDAYNNDLAGLKIALDYSQRQFPSKKHSLIISEMHETGKRSEELNKQISKLLSSYDLDKVIGVGSNLQNQAFINNYYATTDELLQVVTTLFENQTILVKGARKFEFEKIVDALVLKKHQTELIIDLNAVSHNLNYFRQKLKPDVKTLAMVKAFGYGSGGHEIAQLLQYQKVDYLGVAYVDEGISLRKTGIDLPILVLNTSEYEFSSLTTYELEPEIYSLDQLKKLILFSEQEQKQIKIHLKIDTGMHRLGFLDEEIEQVITLIQKASFIQIASIFSHLAASEDPEEDTFTEKQILKFSKNSSEIERNLGITSIKHIANSSAISRFPKAHFDMVRLGIGMYGIGSSREEQKALLSVGVLQSKISQIKLIKKGETVGYGRRGKVTDDSKKIGIIPIGYADGFDRRLGNGKAQVFVKGKLAPTIGSICMDMCMIDLDGVDAKEGDKVEIFGKNISVSQLASQMDTIPYEVLTNIGQRVVRVFVSPE